MYKIILLFIFCHLGIFSSAQKSPDEICKTWYNGEKTAKIQIYKIGLKYFGKIIWLKDSKDKYGKDKLDINNPDVKKRNDNVIGSLMLTNFTYKGDNRYENGQIYDGRNGKTYTCILTLESESKLKVRGFIGLILFGKTDIWTISKN